MPTPLSSARNPTENPDLVVRGQRVILPEGERAAAIHIRQGKVVFVSAYEDFSAGSPVFDADESVVMPGLVDTHVHINEPGRTEWEGFRTATKAAAAGGVTTLIEMPLNSIPAVTTVPAYREKLAAATGKLWVDVGFWGGVIPGNSAELRPLWEAGVFGFKCFLVPSGVPEFSHVVEEELRATLPELKAIGAPLLVHAELPEPIEAACKGLPEKSSPRSYSTWLASRPRDAENAAIDLLIRLANEFNVHIHVVHLASSDAISQLLRARSSGTPVTVETCPHYLTFFAEDIPDGATEFKCAPPIRERENREKLWAALGDKVIDFIATDHSPCPPEMKMRDGGDFLRAWGGISSLQLNLPAVWTEASSRGYSLADLAEWLCRRPAQLAGLALKKGAIAAGHDADLVVWNPDSKFRVTAENLYHRHKITPYSGRELRGAIRTVFLRGQKVFDGGEFSPSPTGEILRRGCV